MYYCPDCGYEFQTALRCAETHDLGFPPFEEIYVCPNCKSKNYYIKDISHCRCCGARILNGKTDYCSEACRIKGEKLWRNEILRRKLNINNPISQILRELNVYNRENKTDYSYGQYVAIIRPKLKKGKKL